MGTADFRAAGEGRASSARPCTCEENAMKRGSGLRKALLILPIAIIVLTVGAIGAARLYLSSGRAGGIVAAQLQDMLGGHVEVQGAHVGLIGDSTVQGIKAYEVGDR